ncbi:transcription initiation factor TFIID subunit 9-like [Phymastichus coffea]|uniref:transcription initiation factor TFIID subunit 9-like n=1 Tax=Phymastichus coffea TaxID=108790 RepID=UPI00273B423E|nr:transcription initiation factor TFIID subunit 9-like [Phymastichus coffea]XP_058804599.1 transcription initiation factor TFIID subunit 9-like [Phymastichus coffea]XP_058804600.1 transcription initiation factor TFIID subunit 9-like [Phymastichus coffea]
MAEKSKNAVQIKHIPKDAQVIVSIMKDMGVTDYEPKVINQLLEFTYRYVTCVLDDSKIYANHSRKKFVDLDDVRLAIKMQLEKSFTNPPPREVLLEVAKTKNNVPLPFVKPSYGLRLPPDRYCLNGANYKLKTSLKKIGKSNISNLNTAGIGGKLGFSIVKRPGTISTISRAQTISVTKPVYKVNPNNQSLVKPQTQIKPKLQISSDCGQIQLPSIKSEVKSESEESNKRKREDDDYDVP